MKPKRKILIVDDEQQDMQKMLLKNKLKSSFVVECETIRTKDHGFKKVDKGKDVLDKEKLEAEIGNLFRSGSFDLVLTDYNLEEENYNGIDIVKYIKSRWDRTDIIMYSGKLSDIVRDMVRINNDERLSDEQVIDAVSKLVKYRIVAFPERPKYVDEACSFLIQNKELSITNELVQLLKQHDQMVFQSCFPEFKGKTFGQIADIIDTRSDQRSEEWITNILEQTIAYLVKVNE